MYTEIEKLLFEDSRDKKRIGNNAAARTPTKLGPRGAVKFPSDSFVGTGGKLKKRNVPDYIKPSEVVSFMMKEKELEMKIMSYTDFKSIKDLNMRVKVLSSYLKAYGAEKLIKEWDISHGAFSGMIFRLNIDREGNVRSDLLKDNNKEHFKGRGSKSIDPKFINENNHLVNVLKVPEEVQTSKESIIPESEIKLQKSIEKPTIQDTDLGGRFNISLNGVFEAKDLNERLLRINDLIDKETSSKFKVKLVIEEVE